MKSLRELELEHYWRAMQTNISTASLSEYREELDLLSTMSEWPRMRQAAQANIGRYDFLGRTTRVANSR